MGNREAKEMLQAKLKCMEAEDLKAIGKGCDGECDNSADIGRERVMKAITVIQPWATLLATGKKHIETRSWKTNYRGEILIHAGKSVKDLFGEIYADDENNLFFCRAGIKNYEDFYAMPRGEIIGKANLVDCFQIDEAYRRKLRRENPAELAFGDYTIGRYAWLMADTVLFDKPIPAKGKQGLWNWEGNSNGKADKTTERQKTED